MPVVCQASREKKSLELLLCFACLAGWLAMLRQRLCLRLRELSVPATPPDENKKHGVARSWWRPEQAVNSSKTATANHRRCLAPCLTLFFLCQDQGRRAVGARLAAELG